MIKNIISKIAIILICFCCISSIIVNANIKSVIDIPREITELENLIENNNLSATYREELSRLKEKMDNDMILEQEELDFIRECRIELIRDKLGEQLFERYCKLMEIKESDVEFTQEDRYELYEIEKLLN